MIDAIPPVSSHQELQETPRPASSLVVPIILQDLNQTTHAFIARYIPDGIKTVPMLEELKKGDLLSYDPQTEHLMHQGISYHVLKGSNVNISQEPIACLGSSPLGREIITLDPNNSPLLNLHYQTLVARLKQQSLIPEQVLEQTSLYIREELFSPSFCSEKLVDRFIQRWQSSEERTLNDFTVTRDEMLVPVIPIEAFIQARAGICRHFSLVTAYILDRLAKEEPSLLPKGRVHYVRDIVSHGSIYGGHAWNLYIPEGEQEAWHVDALWGIVKNCKEKDDLLFLSLAYGEDTIQREITRFMSEKEPS